MKQKKIGMLTFCDNTNYGSWLQTYGLYKAVKSLGYDIELIDYHRDNLPCTEIVTCSGIVELWNRHKGACLSIIMNTLKIEFHFKRDKEKYMELSKKKYTRKNVRSLNCECDMFLVGSDLVWDIRNAQNYTFMLDFATASKKKIAYGASYGYEKIPNSEKNKFKKYLGRFQKISVREKNSKEELENLLHMQVEHVCDPTMLLSNDEWKKFVQKNKQKEKYVLIYMPDEKGKLVKMAQRYSRISHCKVITINRFSGDGNICPLNVQEFLTLIYHAEKIFTASYHGLLFSVYFEKDFAYSNRKPINRMQSVAEILGIEEYEISSKDFDLGKNVDYTSIKQNEQNFRKKSKNILENILR